jgi:uncharacterized sulfatase
VDKAQGEDGKGYWASWVRRAETDPAAAAVVRRYHHRPAEELYDLQADPFEQRNLAGDPAYAGRLAGLRAELDAWMKSEGDQGMPTEELRRPPAKPPAATGGAAKATRPAAAK